MDGSAIIGVVYWKLGNLKTKAPTSHHIPHLRGLQSGLGVEKSNF